MLVFYAAICNGTLQSAYEAALYVIISTFPLILSLLCSCRLLHFVQQSTSLVYFQFVIQDKIKDVETAFWLMLSLSKSTSRSSNEHCTLRVLTFWSLQVTRCTNKFNIQQLYALPTLYLRTCYVFIWEQTAACATYIINWLVFITEMKSVYSAVGTGSLNKAVCASSTDIIRIRTL
jgi:hypothetical protein